MDGQYLPDDEIDIDSLASSEPPEYVPQMFSEGGEVQEEDIEYYAKGGEASFDQSVETMNKYLLADEEDAMPTAYATTPYGVSERAAPEMSTKTAKLMLKQLSTKGGGGGKSKRPKEMSLEAGDLSPAIPELGAPQTEQDKLVQIATARAQYDALERAYQLKAQAAQKAGRGLMRPTFNALAFDKPTLEKPGPLMARTFAKGGEADKKDPELTGINRVSDFIAQRLPASVFPTSGRTFLETVQGKRDPITEGNFSPEELAVMKEMIALKGGDAGDIQYSDYHALAKVMRAQGKIPASTTPSLFSLSDSLGNVQTTLGRFKYGRDAKGNLVVRDTYDFNPPRDPNSMQEQRTAEYGAMGPYSLVREYAGEKIPPGRGREININLGKPVKGAEGSPAAKIFQSARDEYNRQEKELLRLDKPTLEKMARPLARTFQAGGLVRALKSGAKKGASSVDNVVPSSARSLFPEEGPSFLPSIIKEEGGNWMGGSYSPEEFVRPLYKNLNDPAKANSLNKWIDKKLVPYVKNKMGTPSDPVRIQAEKEGILPFPDTVVNAEITSYAKSNSCRPAY
jgi:hypothetical protein